MTSCDTTRISAIDAEAIKKTLLAAAGSGASPDRLVDIAQQSTRQWPDADMYAHFGPVVDDDGYIVGFGSTSPAGPRKVSRRRRPKPAAAAALGQRRRARRSILSLPLAGRIDLIDDVREEAQRRHAGLMEALDAEPARCPLADAQRPPRTSLVDVIAKVRLSLGYPGKKS